MTHIVAALFLAAAMLTGATLAYREQACEMLKCERLRASLQVVVFLSAEGATPLYARYPHTALRQQASSSPS